MKCGSLNANLIDKELFMKISDTKSTIQSEKSESSKLKSSKWGSDKTGRIKLFF